MDKIKIARRAITFHRAAGLLKGLLTLPSWKPAGFETEDRLMSERKLPRKVIAEIVKLVEWVKAHPSGTWQDDPEIDGIYKRWRGLIRNGLNLLDGNGTMRGVDGLSCDGELFLLEHSREAMPARRPGRPPDETIDREQDRRIMDAWETGNYCNVKELAQAWNLDEREVKKALDRERKRRDKPQEGS